MQLRRLSLFSSGVGFFEHGGNVTGHAQFDLPYSKNAMNDVLKSLVVNDPASSPTITYHAENTLEQTMKGLKLDLKQHSHIAALLNSLKGAEIEVLIPEPLKGIIMLVEHRIEIHTKNETGMGTTYISLLTSENIRVVSLNEVRAFTFTDPEINTDAKRALSVMLQSRDSETRNLNVNLPGAEGKTRHVSLSYVIPTPVWKVSYRLDLSQKSPFLQGWAIVDNDSDNDWEGVELALVTGKPVSFVQNLYAPYHLTRPTLPISTSGIAEVRTYDSGTPRSKPTTSKRSSSSGGGDILSQSEMDSLLCSMVSGSDYSYLEEDAFSISRGIIETASGRAAGDQFEFTIKTPVTLPRHQSAMLPLVEGTVTAEKMLVFSPINTSELEVKYPAIAAELTNNTGMKLPAGAITVYDGGTYAGDSLIAFFPMDEKRMISFGEDMTVTCSFSFKTGHEYSAVLIKSGIMKIDTRRVDRTEYRFRNATSETKKLILEHPIDVKAQLTEPADYFEKTHDLYRFEILLPPGETTFAVAETEPLSHETSLSNKSRVEFETHISSNYIPENVREKFRQVIKLQQAIHDENDKVKKLKTRIDQLCKEQDRIRKNLEAAGSQTQQGQKYLSRLAQQDTEIDEAQSAILAAEQSAKEAETAYQKYVHEIYFDSVGG